VLPRGWDGQREGIDLKDAIGAVDLTTVKTSRFSSRAVNVRRWRAHAEFSGATLPHRLTVPDGPDGRPGERLMVPSLSLYEPRIGPDGSREDFRVLVDRHGSTLAAVCLWRAAGMCEVEEAAWGTLTRTLVKGMQGADKPISDRVAGEHAFRYWFGLGRWRVTEWKLAHAGWLYVVGVFNWAPDAEQQLTVARAREVLETWTWLPEPATADRR
jgi:hypothetical protein